MMATLSGFDQQIKIQTSPITQVKVGLGDIHARTIGGKISIGHESIFMGRNQFAQTFGAILFTCFNHELGIKSEPATGFDNGFQCAHVRCVLRLIVCSTPTINMITVTA